MQLQKALKGEEASIALAKIRESRKGFFGDLYIEGENVRPLMYCFYPTKNVVSYFPKSPLSGKEKEKLLKAIELTIRTLYEKINYPFKQPVVNFNSDLGIFHVKLTMNQMKNLKKFIKNEGAPDIPTAFRMCLEEGLSKLSTEKTIGRSLSKNRDRWPNIYSAWLSGRFGKNLAKVYMAALDLLEIKLKEKSKKK